MSSAWTGCAPRLWSSAGGRGAALRGQRRRHPRVGSLYRRSPSTAVYGRIGTSTVRFGTVTSWLVDVINLLTGNLDRPGGAMFAASPVGLAPRPPKPGRGFSVGRWHSRVSGAGEVTSEFPPPCCRRRSETPGEGQVRAGHHRRKPGALGSRRRSAQCRAGDLGFHGLDRPVPQRDHLPCRRDPAPPRPRTHRISISCCPMSRSATPLATRHRCSSCPTTDRTKSRSCAD